jgi:hypothetical protein
LMVCIVMGNYHGCSSRIETANWWLPLSFIHKLDGRWSCMSMRFLINFGFMCKLKVVEGGCFKTNKK